MVSLAASASIPATPDTLLEMGRAAWERLWTAGQGWLNAKTDWAIMERLCYGYDEREALLAEVGRVGYTVIGSTGQPRPNPLLSRLATVDAMITKYEQLCGFTPADRTRVGFREPKPPSALEEIIARNQRRRPAVDGKAAERLDSRGRVDPRRGAGAGGHRGLGVVVASEDRVEECLREPPDQGINGGHQRYGVAA